MSHVHDQSVVHHLPAIENVLEPWRWDQESYTGSHFDNHLLVLNAENPVTINLHRAPESSERRRTRNSIISRGAAISFTYKAWDGVKTTTVEKDVPYEVQCEGSFYFARQQSWHGSGIVFNLKKFDIEPIIFPHGITDANPFLSGRLAFQCDWIGAKTLSIWRDSIHKIFKFYNVKSGHHCLDYNIPRSLVIPWTASGETRMMPLDLRVEEGGVERMVWTGATKLDVPDLSFTPDEDE